MINCTDEPKGFKFKLDVVEKCCVAVLSALLVASIIGRHTSILPNSFFYASVIVGLYYFTCYRKKNLYVAIENQVITIWMPMFFTPKEITLKDITRTSVSDKKIELYYSFNGSEKKSTIYSIMLKAEDWKELSGIIGSWS